MKKIIQIEPNNIKKIRESKGLSQEELSIKSGISYGHFSDLENSKKRLNTTSMNKIANALDVKPEDLIREDLVLEPNINSKSKTNLTLLREKAGLTQVDIAKKLNISKQYISLLEKDASKIGEDIKNKLASLFNVDPKEIIKEASNSTVIEHKKINKENSEANVDIRLYNYKLSAGSGVSIFDDEKVEIVTVARRLLESITKINFNNLILLEVQGLFMEPTISDGDTILIDTGVNTLDKEGIFAFTWGDNFYIKFLQPLPNKILAISLNTKVPPFEIPLPPTEDAPLKIIGLAKGKAFEPFK